MKCAFMSTHLNGHSEDQESRDTEKDKEIRTDLGSKTSGRLHSWYESDRVQDKTK